MAWWSRCWRTATWCRWIRRPARNASALRAYDTRQELTLRWERQFDEDQLATALGVHGEVYVIGDRAGTAQLQQLDATTGATRAALDLDLNLASGIGAPAEGVLVALPDRSVGVLGTDAGNSCVARFIAVRDSGSALSVAWDVVPGAELGSDRGVERVRVLENRSLLVGWVGDGLVAAGPVAGDGGRQDHGRAIHLWCSQGLDGRSRPWMVRPLCRRVKGWCATNACGTRAPNSRAAGQPGSRAAEQAGRQWQDPSPASRSAPSGFVSALLVAPALQGGPEGLASPFDRRQVSRGAGRRSTFVGCSDELPCRIVQRDVVRT